MFQGPGIIPIAAFGTRDNRPAGRSGLQRRFLRFFRALPQDSLEEALELPRPDRMLQLPDRLRLDLADALARHLEDPADLLQRVGVAGADPVAQLDDLALAERQGLEHR